MPRLPPVLEKIAVLIPSRLPATSTSAPPELPGLSAAAVAERNLDVVGAFDDVIVGEQVAGGRDDHARAEADLTLLGRLAGSVAEEEAEHRIVVARPLRDAAGGDADDRRRGPLGRIGVARRRRAGADQGDALHRRRQRHGGRGCGSDGRLRAALEPRRLERRDDEQQRDRDRHRLREEEPSLAHRRRRSTAPESEPPLSRAGRIDNGAWLHPSTGRSR